jgi:hypothetical protein
MWEEQRKSRDKKGSRVRSGRFGVPQWPVAAVAAVASAPAAE